MKLELYQVDAFTDRLFGGNPAAVVPLEQWIDEDLMQHLAMENNLSETAFIGPAGDSESDFKIRWFTPLSEINLCGHATLASAFVLFNKLGFQKDKIRLSCKSGLLIINREGDLISMDFPAWEPALLEDPDPEILMALGNPNIKSVNKSRDILIELEDEEEVLSVTPDFTRLKTTGAKVIITAQGKRVDFVSRFFAPSVGVDEDPVTGSAHSQLIPFWAQKLGKDRLHALQLSKRGGELWCHFRGDRVTISGKAVFYMKGDFQI